MRNSYDAADVGRMIEQVGGRIAAAFDRDKPLNIVGIRQGGEVLAERLARTLAAQGFKHIGRGILDITLYRDDLSEIGPRPLVRPTKIDIDIDAQPLLLVDDVLFTGRSIRAAMDALSDFGRPSAIRLAVLVDRGGREMALQPGFLGLTLTDVAQNHPAYVHLSEIDAKDAILV